MVYLIPFRRIKFTFKTVKHHIQHLSLTLVEGRVMMFVPKHSLFHNPFGLVESYLHRFLQCLNKPHYPFRDIQVALLRPLKMIVIIIAMLQYLRRQTVIPFRRTISTRQQVLRYRAAYTPIAVIKGMNSDKPQMSHSSLHQRINHFRRRIQPAEKILHHARHITTWWSLIVHLLTSQWSRNNLHCLLFITPFSNIYLIHTASPHWKKRCMPCE